MGARGGGGGYTAIKESSVFKTLVVFMEILKKKKKVQSPPRFSFNMDKGSIGPYQIIECV